MTEFTASNGVQVFESTLDDEFRRLTVGGSSNVLLLDEEVVALAEYFQAERDAELGRWRWPENPDYAVRGWQGLAAAVVTNEATGDVVLYYRDDLPSSPLSPSFASAARAYFDAHPEPKKPWHDAKISETWRLEPFDVNYNVVGGASGNCQARRIWPEATE